MTNYGYTLMTEQAGPVQLVRDAQAAERAGFDFEVMSDHFSPWLDSQGHAPNAWATLGAVAQATSRVNAELPGPAAFAGASQFVRPDDMAASIPCGPDVIGHVDAVREFEKAGFTDIAVVQVGGDSQSAFLEWAEQELLPALRG